MLITSLDNKKIKLYASLHDSKQRNNNKLFLVEGMHLVYEAYKCGLLEDILLLDGDCLEFSYSKEITYVTYDILKKVSSLTNPSNVIGVVKFMDKKIDSGNILILDNIQDPGNLGTIIRSACAFNIKNIILSTNSVDLYNDKVLRATQGMFFNTNVLYGDLVSIIKDLKKNGYTILGTDVKSGVDVRDINYSNYALVMGNEGHGVSTEVKSLCDKNLYISMNKNCESLNVGVATSILMYELNRGHYE